MPPAQPDRTYFHFERELVWRVAYPHARKSGEGKYPAITDQERLARKHQQDTQWSKDAYWKAELKKNYYLPGPDASPVNFSYQLKGSTLAVPYHVVGPMAWEYPYHNGQVQEDLPDRLVPASLYGVKVASPGYLSAYHGPATQVQALAAYDSGKWYQDRNATLVGYAGQGHQQQAVFGVLGGRRTFVLFCHPGPLEYLSRGHCPAVPMHGAGL